MKKHLPLLTLIAVVALVVGGYLGYSSYSQRETPPAVRDAKIPLTKIDKSADVQSSPESQNKVSSKAIAETNVPPVNAKAGEILVQGEIKAVDVEKRILTIDQQMDDNSVKAGPNIPVGKDALIRSSKEVLSLAQVKPGDSAGVIVTKEGQARAVLINY